MLGGFRVLDLSDYKGYLCGKILANMGADVVKIEPPGGDPGRDVGPFYKDVPEREKSLYWMSWNDSKRSVTLDIASKVGQNRFKELAETSDFIIESFRPGFMDELEIGYDVVREMNKSIVWVSITPFGQDGPYRDYETSDLVSMALGGAMKMNGDPDRAPLRMNPDHSFAFAGATAFVGAMIAHYYRMSTGIGQFVDLSIQEASAQETFMYPPTYDLTKFVNQRMGIYYGQYSPKHGIWKNRWNYPCKDGWVRYAIRGGHTGLKQQTALTKWMDENGMAGVLKEIDWANFDPTSEPPERVQEIQDTIETFFLTKTLQEVEKNSVQRGTRANAMLTPGDALEHPQFVHRKTFQYLNYPCIDVPVPVAGQVFISNACHSTALQRSPLIGENDDDIFYKSESETSRVRAKIEGTDTEVKSGRSRKVFEGINIIALSSAVTGPWATKAMSDYGAEVCKVETMKHPDSLRYQVPYKDGKPDPNKSSHFAFMNTGKKSILLDLTREEGRNVFKRLVRDWGDVVVQNFGPGVVSKLGLDYDELVKINPDLIMVSASIFGQTGPYGKIAAWGGATSAVAAHYSMTGWPDRGPTNPGLTVTGDILGPFYIIGVLTAALDYRRRTGRGQNIDISQIECLANVFGPWYMDAHVNARRPQRHGNRNPYAAPHGVYECAGDDQWVAITVMTEDNWKDFCELTAIVETSDHRFNTLEMRKKNEDELDALITVWTKKRDNREIMTLLQSLCIPAGCVYDLADVMERDPQVRHRGLFVPVDHPGIGVLNERRLPFRLSETPEELQSSPIMGEHTEYFLQDVLNMEDEEIVDLVANGVLA